MNTAREVEELEGIVGAARGWRIASASVIGDYTARGDDERRRLDRIAAGVLDSISTLLDLSEGIDDDAYAACRDGRRAWIMARQWLRRSPVNQTAVHVGELSRLVHETIRAESNMLTAHGAMLEELTAFDEWSRARLDALRGVPDVPAGDAGGWGASKREHPKLKPSEARAGESLLWVRDFEVKREEVPDEGEKEYSRRRWELIGEHGCPVYFDQNGQPIDGGRPSYESWSRYVREYLRVMEPPEGGAPGRSFVKRADLADARPVDS